jgi:magnesium transporter
MEGLTPVEAWKVLQYADPATRAEIFHFLEWDRQVELLADQDQLQVAALVSVLSADDAVDLLQELPASRVESILALVPASDRRSIQKLQSFAEGTAGALMTTEAACLREDLTVRAAVEELAEHHHSAFMVLLLAEAVAAAIKAAAHPAQQQHSYLMLKLTQTLRRLEFQF